MNGQWGYIDKQGWMVIKPKFEAAQAFRNGRAAVKLDGLWGYIDGKGQIVVEPPAFTNRFIHPLKNIPASIKEIPAE